MRNYLYLSAAIITLLHSCQNPPKDNYDNEIPNIIEFRNRLEFDSICSAIKKETQKKIHNGEIEIVFKDTFHYNKEYIIFEKVLLSKSGLKLNNKYQLDFEECYREKMDSVIRYKYGRNYKDSIITLAYQVTDSIIKSKR
ncbi:MAG: hypothetical protein IPN22_11010 [Bacteroidetes bacterium]|nr:hypothetical protein [Bacteroidota bacterium]